MSKPRRPVVFICRHGEREDYKWKARGENWQSQADRPWDSPLSDGGHLQGAAAGRAIAKHCERLGLSPVGEIYVSPLLRCVQTAAASALPLGIGSINVCPALAESMNESWYRSWAVPGADSTWGGPPGCSDGVPVDETLLHPAALQPSKGCLPSASELNSAMAARAEETKDNKGVGGGKASSGANGSSNGDANGSANGGANGSSNDGDNGGTKGNAKGGKQQQQQGCAPPPHSPSFPLIVPVANSRSNSRRVSDSNSGSSLAGGGGAASPANPHHEDANEDANDSDGSAASFERACNPPLEYTWRCSETHEQQTTRTVRLCNALRDRQQQTLQQQEQQQERQHQLRREEGLADKERTLESPSPASPPPSLGAPQSPAHDSCPQPPPLQTHQQASSGSESPPLSSSPSSSLSVLLVSHGGPTTHLYQALTGIKRAPSTGYCGLFCYTWVPSSSSCSSCGGGSGASTDASDDDTRSSSNSLPPPQAAGSCSGSSGGSTSSPDSSDSSSPVPEGERSGGHWECLLVADHEHLKEVSGATMAGPNDMVEQVVA